LTEENVKVATLSGTALTVSPFCRWVERAIVTSRLRDSNSESRYVSCIFAETKRI